jgi:hypothetical protein
MTARIQRRPHASHLLLVACLSVVALAFAAPPVAAQEVESNKVGGGGGSRAAAMCNDGEVMVGVFGQYHSWVDRLGVRCVRVSVSGQWIGTPRNGPAHGGTGGSQSLQVSCPTNTAVVGITGAAGMYIHRIGLLCKPLGADARVSGSNSTQPAVGASGGTNFAATSCDTDGRPAIGFHAWTGMWVDAVRLGCAHRRPPAPASQSSPALGSTVTSFRPQFGWSGVALANRYQIEVGQSTVTGNSTTNSWTPPSDLPFTGGGSRWSWSVRACNGNGCSPYVFTHFFFDAPGANYVSTQTNSPAKVNNQVHFTVALQRVADRNTTVMWRLSPDACFDQSSSGTPYQPGAKNSATIQAGQNSVQLTVRIRNQASCVTSGRLETWVRLLDSTSAPYYRTSDFSMTW